MQKSNGPPAPRVLTALLILGLLALGWDALSVNRRQSENDLRSDGCVYELIIDGLPHGIALKSGPSRLSDIITSTYGNISPEQSSEIVPCNSRINIDGGHVEVSKIPGGALVAAGFILDLNQADEQDLIAIPGIGPQLAMRILQHRRSNGPFKSPQELAGIRGIGKKKAATLAPYFRTGDM